MDPLATPLLGVSLLTIKAWMAGSTAVGPYTPWIDAMPYSKPGLELNEVRKGRT
jgi:hypothetical protein